MRIACTQKPKLVTRAIGREVIDEDDVVIILRQLEVELLRNRVVYGNNVLRLVVARY